MSGRRLAKRSIIGSRVAVPLQDGKYYSGTIQAVKTTEGVTDVKYSVKVDSCTDVREYRDIQIVGTGFQNIGNVPLTAGQKVYLTYCGREVCGQIVKQDPTSDILHLRISSQNRESPVEIRRKVEELRLLESRKSARLLDMSSESEQQRGKCSPDVIISSSSSIDVPNYNGSRKRRTSFTDESIGSDVEEECVMDECAAAMVLMSLSCSPRSPAWSEGFRYGEPISPTPSSGGSSWESPGFTQSSDEGIDMDDDSSSTKGVTRTVFKCTWPGCSAVTNSCPSIEKHVRITHLGPKQDSELSDHEEEFYYNEIDVAVENIGGPTPPSSPSPPSHLPTLSHMDMARPPHEDPEYRRAWGGGGAASPINIPGMGPQQVGWHTVVVTSGSPSSPQKYLRLSPNKGNSPKSGSGVSRRPRGDTKKCRKVYGIDHRDLWCTQCKWKKACTRFLDPRKVARSLDMDLLPQN